MVLITGAGRGMGKAFALAFAGQGARVVINDIQAAGLGTVADTIREKGGNEKFLDGIIKGDLDSFRAGIPMGRLAISEEQSDMVLFLSSEHTNHITGQTFFVDGGQTMV